MKAILIISILIVALGCTPEKYEITNLNNNEIELMGHGGMGFSDLYPINTAESLMRCISEGADGSEIDIQLTADNVLVGFHNSDLEGNTNLTGRIRDYTWNELKEARYTTTPQLNYKILNLRDFFGDVGGVDKYTFTLDIKIYPGDNEYLAYIDEFTDALEDLYDDYSIDSTVFIEAQDQYFLTEMATKDAQIRQYIYPATFQDGFLAALSLGLHGISIDTDKVTSEQIEFAHDAGIFVTVWGVSSKKENRDAIRKNPDMIQTDKVAYLVKQLK
jgi:glycerophosphoryl diester phosphodiesterase